MCPDREYAKQQQPQYAARRHAQLRRCAARRRRPAAAAAAAVSAQGAARSCSLATHGFVPSVGLLLQLVCIRGDERVVFAELARYHERGVAVPVQQLCMHDREVKRESEPAEA